METITFYTKKNCPLCESAKQLLVTLKEETDFTLEEVDIYSNDKLLERYQVMIPVVEIDGKEIDYGQIDLEKVHKALNRQK